MRPYHQWHETQRSKPYGWFIIALAIALLAGCCPTVTESITSNTTYRDTVFIPQPVDGSGISVDPEYWEAVNAELIRLYSENDSLRGRVPDTAKIKEYIKAKPFSGKWDLVKVTPSGDSVYIVFKLKNADGTFEYRFVAAPIKAKLADTNTLKVQEKKPEWYETLWADFKDVILVILLVLVGLGWAFDRFRLRQTPL